MTVARMACASIESLHFLWPQKKKRILEKSRRRLCLNESEIRSRERQCHMRALIDVQGYMGLTDASSVREMASFFCLGDKNPVFLTALTFVVVM